MKFNLVLFVKIWLFMVIYNDKIVILNFEGIAHNKIFHGDRTMEPLIIS